MGVKVPKDIIVHRVVKGRTTPRGYEVSEYGSSFEKQRYYKTHADGFNAFKIVDGKKIRTPMDYGLNPNESVSLTINHYIRQIADERFRKAIKPLRVTGAKIPTLEAGTAETRIHPAFQRKVFAGKKITPAEGVTPGKTLGQLRGELERLDQANVFGGLSDVAEQRLTDLSRAVARAEKAGLKDTDIVIKAVGEGVAEKVT
ncbi:hypothetical protein LCGC14_3080890, partial [marine sediment metagenome]